MIEEISGFAGDAIILNIGWRPRLRQRSDAAPSPHNICRRQRRKFASLFFHQSKNMLVRGFYERLRCCSSDECRAAASAICALLTRNNTSRPRRRRCFASAHDTSALSGLLFQQKQRQYGRYFCLYLARYAKIMREKLPTPAHSRVAIFFSAAGLPSSKHRWAS